MCHEWTNMFEYLIRYTQIFKISWEIIPGFGCMVAKTSFQCVCSRFCQI